jgi:hypothetical protein
VDDTSANNNKAVKVWQEKCSPSKIVDLFWHAHMLAPKKYTEDCKFLIGEVVDHNAAYVAPSPGEKGSDVESKMMHLYNFENRSHAFGCKRSGILRSTDFRVHCIAADILVAEMFDGEEECG